MSIAAKDTMPPLPAGFVDKLAAIVGEAGLITDPAVMAAYIEETRGLYEGASPAVVRPATTQEVADVVRACADANVAMVPQGGNTGLCGGAVANGEVIINLARLNQVREKSESNNTGATRVTLHGVPDLMIPALTQRNRNFAQGARHPFDVKIKNQGGWISRRGTLRDVPHSSGRPGPGSASETSTSARR